MSDNSSNNKRLAKNSLFLSIRMVIVLAISLYTTRVVLKVLGVEDYGVYNVVCGFVAMFSFLNTSMSNGIQRFFNYELGKNGEAGANKVYCTALYIQAILAIIIVALTESIGLWYLHNKMVIPDGRMFAAEWIFQLSIMSFIFVIMQAPFTASVMAHEKMDFYAVVSILDAVLKLGIVLVLPLLLGDSLIWYGVFISLISIVNFLIYFVYSKRSFPEIKFKKGFDGSLFKSMLGFSGWNIFGSFSGVMQEQGINLVINFFFGPVVNAARGVAAQVNAGLEGFVTNITMPVRPQVVQSYACGDNRRMMNLTFSISKLSCCFLLMMAVPVSIEINYVLHIWLGENVPDYAAIFTVIILFGSLISNLNAATSNVVHATGEMKQYQFWGSLIKISSVPISFIILKAYLQPALALLTVLVCRLAGHIVGLFIVRKLVNLSLKEYLIKVVVPILLVMVISVGFSFPFHYFMHEGFLRLIVVTVVGSTTAALSIYYIALDKNEKQLASQLLGSVLNKIKPKR